MTEAGTAASPAAACWSAVAAEWMAGGTVSLGDGKAGTGEDMTALPAIEAGLNGNLGSGEKELPCCSVCSDGVAAAGSNSFFASRRPLTAADATRSFCSSCSATESGGES